MDKVFEPTLVARHNDTGLVPVDIAVHEPQPEPEPIADTTTVSTGETTGSSAWVIPVLVGVAMAGVVSSGWLIGQWQNTHAQLEQERNLLLLERLRDASPVTPREVTQQAKPVAASQPPPPPEPEWVASLEPLTLPIRQVAAPEPPDAPAPSASLSRPTEPVQGPRPQLTGVVQGPGGNSSAIFQLGKSSLSTGIGEGIGSSGWILDAVSDSGAVIRRNDERHHLTVGGMF